MPHLEVVLEAAPKWGLLVDVLREVQSKRAEWRAAGILSKEHRETGPDDGRPAAADRLPGGDRSTGSKGSGTGMPAGSVRRGQTNDGEDEDDDEVQIVEPPSSSGAPVRAPLRETEGLSLGDSWDGETGYSSIKIKTRGSNRPARLIVTIPT